MPRSALESLARRAAKAAFQLRIPPNPVHRALAWEYRTRSFALSELARILYYQPMFEAQCARVGQGVRMEVVPTSKQPAVANVHLVLGDRVRLSARTTFSGARNAPVKARIEVGDDTYVGHGVVLRAGLGMRIGKHVLVASNALLSSDPGHPMDAAARRTEPAPAGSLGHLVIEDDVWIAYGAAVLGSVRVGRGSVVAAHAVVTKDVPPYSVVAGNPARVVRTLKPSEVPQVAAAAAAAAQAGATAPGARGGPNRVRHPLPAEWVFDLDSGVGRKVAEAVRGLRNAIAPEAAPAWTPPAVAVTPEVSPLETAAPEAAAPEAAAPKSAVPQLASAAAVEAVQAAPAPRAEG
jgi:acetyltransferase-like isoleucine patch superfamily enzyme